MRSKNKTEAPGLVQKKPQIGESDLADAVNKAMRARELLEDAGSYFKRPPPLGREHIQQLATKGQRKVENATKYYRMKRKVVEDLCGGFLPADLKEKLPPADSIMIGISEAVVAALACGGGCRGRCHHVQ